MRREAIRVERRALLASALAASVLPHRSAHAAVDPRWAVDLPTGVTPAPIGDRRVYLPYELWHYDAAWDAAPPPQQPWGHPILGAYASDNQAVVRQHAEWLAGAGVDAILLDWSNDIGADNRVDRGNHAVLFIERASLALAETFVTLPQRPRISIFIGFPQDHAAPTDGALQAKADQIHAQFVANPRFAPLVERLDGKPLLLVYADTPAAFQHGLPPWRDPRFTVRYMTGFLTEQPALVGAGRRSRFGYWSWEDRGPQTIAYAGAHPECMTVVAAWRGATSPGRDGGRTFLAEWARVRAAGPRVVFLNGWNEWKRHEQPSAEISKDIEPSTEFGTKYLDLAREQIALYKMGR